MTPADRSAPPGPSANPLFDVAALDHTLLNITRRCNQRCVFCYEGDRVGWSEPDFPEVQRLLRDAAARHEAVVLMGGEALLRKDILEVLRYARSLDLWVTVFTNGRALAREGFPAALAEAGLDGIVFSAHFPDAATHARGTRTSPKTFREFVRGLENVGRYQQAAASGGGKVLRVGAEILLYRDTFGRLSELRRLLDGTLGAGYAGISLKGLQPLRGGGGTGEPLLPPLRAQRDELVAFLAERPDALTLLVSLPLCLFPGSEHRSLDVLYQARRVQLLSNFQDKRALAAEGDRARLYRENPYRWVCRTCTLLPLCPTSRTSWYRPEMAPRADQKPIPFRAVRPEDVLARCGFGPAPAPDGAAFAAVSLPEAPVVAALEALTEGPLVVADVSCAEHPLLVAAARFEGRPVRVAFGVPRPGATAGHLVAGYALTVAAEDGPPLSAAAVRRVLAALAAVPLPPPAAWERDASALGLALPVWEAAAALSRHLGESLWPGSVLAAEFTVVACEFDAAGGLVVALRHADGLTAALRLYAGPLAAVRPPWPGAPLAWQDAATAVYLELTADPGDDVLRRHRLLEGLAAALRDRLADAPAAAAAAGAAAEHPEPAAERPEPAASRPEPAASRPEPAASRPEPAASRPDAGAAPGPLPPAGPPALQDAAHTVTVVLRDREGRQPDRVFFIGRPEEGVPVFRRVGPVAIGHLPGPRGKAFDVLTALLERVAQHLGAPPDAATRPRWIATLRHHLLRSPLARRFHVDVS